MLKRLMLATVALAGLAWAQSSSVSGYFASPRQRFEVKDAVVVWWPKWESLTNRLEIDIFARKLSDGERRAFLSSLGGKQVSGGKSVPYVEKTARFQVTVYFETPPQDFATGTISGADRGLFIPPDEWDLTYLAVSGKPPEMKFGDGLNLKLSGPVQEGKTIEFQGQLKRKTGSEFDDWNFQLSLPLAVRTF